MFVTACPFEFLIDILFILPFRFYNTLTVDGGATGARRFVPTPVFPVLGDIFILGVERWPMVVPTFVESVGTGTTSM